MSNSPHRSPSQPRGATRRRPVVDGILASPRLFSAVVVFAVVAGVLRHQGLETATAVLLGWNAAVGLHLVLTFHMMARSEAARTLARARRLDESAGAILVFSATAAVASLVAIFAELATVRGLPGSERWLHAGLAALTVAASWVFIQVMFAIHYAHAYAIAHDEGRDPGLKIPGEVLPDYWDFLYVAVSIGTSGQTADVEFTAKAQRRVGLAHAILSFFFNATVLALTVNIAAGLI